MSDNWRDLSPEHVAAMCPACKTPVGIPQATDPNYEPDSPAWDLFCPACGHTWTEDDIMALALAWYGAGAYAALERGEK